MADAVFLDTAGLVALHLTTDGLHSAAKHTFAVLIRAGATFVTSEWVLAEFLNHCSTPVRRAGALMMVRELQSDATVGIVPAAHESFMLALDLYGARPDKEWGLVDCASMLICKDRHIRRVFTHDRHFRQAGLDVLL